MYGARVRTTAIHAYGTTVNHSYPYHSTTLSTRRCVPQYLIHSATPMHWALCLQTTHWLPSRRCGWLTDRLPSTIHISPHHHSCHPDAVAWTWSYGQLSTASRVQTLESICTTYLHALPLHLASGIAHLPCRRNLLHTTVIPLLHITTQHLS